LFLFGFLKIGYELAFVKKRLCCCLFRFELLAPKIMILELGMVGEKESWLWGGRRRKEWVNRV
jgi:hypothetical protein